jgi:hypothetical protein
MTDLPTRSTLSGADLSIVVEKATAMPWLGRPLNQ